jgi:hypothetical protein
VRVAAEREAEQAREAYRQAAFTGWLVTASLVGTGEMRSFGEYLAAIGLGADVQQGQGQQAAPARGGPTREESLAAADEALAYFRTHRKKVAGRSQQIAERDKRRQRRRERRGG